MPTQNIPHPPGHVPTCVVAPVAVRAIFCSWRTLGQVIVAVIPIPTAQGEGEQSDIVGHTTPARCPCDTLYLV